jgi:hypothetical protein
MGIKKLVGSVLLFVIVFVKSNAQIKIAPELGLSFSNNRMIGSHSNSLLRTKQFWGLPMAGINLYKEYPKSLIGVNFTISTVGLAAIWYNPTFENPKKQGYKMGSESIGTSLFLLGIQYSYKWKEIHLWQILSTQYRPDIAPTYKINIKLEPTISFNLNKVQRTNWNPSYGLPKDSTQLTGDSNVVSSSNGKFNTGITDKDDNIVKNYVGFSVTTGIKFQFYNQKRDKICFNLMYNQGFVDLLYTDLNVKIKNNKSMEETQIKEYFASRGSYLSFSISYPINLIADSNKKSTKISF